VTGQLEAKQRRLCSWVACLAVAGLVASLAVAGAPPVWPSTAEPGFRTADEIRAGYESRRDTLIQALLLDPGGNLWHAASKGIATLYREPDAPLQGVMHLQQAAGGDPKCEECCAPPLSGQCGEGAGYWCLPLLMRAYYLFSPGSTFEGGRYAGRIPAQFSQKLAGFFGSYLRKGAGKGYGDCSENLEPRCRAEYSIDRHDYPPFKYISQSDNHTVLQASTILLSTQMLKDGSPEYAALYEEWRDWWSQFLDALARRGFWETASPTYVERHLAPIYNLYDFCEDELIRKKAEMLIDWYWAEIAQEMLYGVRGGAKMRVYDAVEGDRGSMSARNDAMYGVYYLYFGDSDFAQSPAMPNAEMYSAIFATSSYRLPNVLLELGANPEARGSFEVKQRRKGSCFVWDSHNGGDRPYNSRRYAYVTPDYVLGSFQSDADKQFMPLAGQTPHMQHGLVFATSPEARIVWGERGAISSGHINVFQHKNAVILSLAGQPQLRMNYGFPEHGVLDHVEEEGQWIFVREGKAYAAIRRFHEVMIIEAARRIDYGGDFSRFKLAIGQTDLSLSAADIDSGFIRYITTGGDEMYFPLTETEGSCRYSCVCVPSDAKLPRVNGRVVDWKDYALFDGPYVQSEWDGGYIEVSFNEEWLTLDFRDADNPTKADSGILLPTATPSVTATPSATATRTTRPSPTATRTPRPSLTTTRSPTPRPTTTHTRTASPTARPTRTATAVPLPTMAVSTATPSATAMLSATATPSPSLQPTATTSPSPTKRPTQTATLVVLPTLTVPPTATPPQPSPTLTATHTPTEWITETPTSGPLPTLTVTRQVAPTHTATPWLEPTPTPTPVGEESPLPAWLQELLDRLRELLERLRDQLQEVYRPLTP
jgi:hypothetical protein